MLGLGVLQVPCPHLSCLGLQCARQAPFLVRASGGRTGEAVASSRLPRHSLPLCETPAVSPRPPPGGCQCFQLLVQTLSTVKWNVWVQGNRVWHGWLGLGGVMCVHAHGSWSWDQTTAPGDQRGAFT